MLSARRAVAHQRPSIPPAPSAPPRARRLGRGRGERRRVRRPRAAGCSPRRSTGRRSSSSTSRSASPSQSRHGRPCPPRAARRGGRIDVARRAARHGRARRADLRRSSRRPTPAGARPQTLGLLAAAPRRTRRVRRPSSRGRAEPLGAAARVPAAHRPSSRSALMVAGMGTVLSSLLLSHDLPAGGPRALRAAHGAGVPSRARSCSLLAAHAGPAPRRAPRRQARVGRWHDPRRGRCPAAVRRCPTDGSLPRRRAARIACCWTSRSDSRHRGSSSPAMSGVGHHEAGLVSGLLTTSHEIGIALVLPVLSTIARQRLPSATRSGRRRRWRPAPRYWRWSPSARSDVAPGSTRGLRALKLARRARRRRTQHRGDPRRGRAPSWPTGPRRGWARSPRRRGSPARPSTRTSASREALLNAVAERALAQTLAAIDAARAGAGRSKRRARAAHHRRGGARWRATPACSRRSRPPPPSREEVHAFHAPVLGAGRSTGGAGSVRRAAEPGSPRRSSR